MMDKTSRKRQQRSERNNLSCFDRLLLFLSSDIESMKGGERNSKMEEETTEENENEKDKKGEEK